jgi:hypothetical protein
MGWPCWLPQLGCAKMGSVTCRSIWAAGALAGALLLAGCGAGNAVRETGQTFDKYACLARAWKGETPCPAEPPQQ